MKIKSKSEITIKTKSLYHGDLIVRQKIVEGEKIIAEGQRCNLLLTEDLAISLLDALHIWCDKARLSGNEVNIKLTEEI